MVCPTGCILSADRRSQVVESAERLEVVEGGRYRELVVTVVAVGHKGVDTFADGLPVSSPGMEITGADFVTVPTRDFARACEFYGEVLGLERSIQWGDMPAAEFETGSLTIAVMQSDGFGIEFARHGHPIALHVDDVEAARAELEAKGVSFVAATMDSGVCHMAHFADPDGNALMLHNRYAPRG